MRHIEITIEAEHEETAIVKMLMSYLTSYLRNTLPVKVATTGVEPPLYGGGEHTALKNDLLRQMRGRGIKLRIDKKTVTGENPTQPQSSDSLLDATLTELNQNTGYYKAALAHGSSYIERSATDLALKCFEALAKPMVYLLAHLGKAERPADELNAMSSDMELQDLLKVTKIRTVYAAEEAHAEMDRQLATYIASSRDNGGQFMTAPFFEAEPEVADSLARAAKVIQSDLLAMVDQQGTFENWCNEATLTQRMNGENVNTWLAKKAWDELLQRFSSSLLIQAIREQVYQAYRVSGTSKELVALTTISQDGVVDLSKHLDTRSELATYLDRWLTAYTGGEYRTYVYSIDCTPDNPEDPEDTYTLICGAFTDVSYRSVEGEMLEDAVHEHMPDRIFTALNFHVDDWIEIPAIRATPGQDELYLKGQNDSVDGRCVKYLHMSIDNTIRISIINHSILNGVSKDEFKTLATKVGYSPLELARFFNFYEPLNLHRLFDLAEQLYQ